MRIIVTGAAGFIGSVLSLRAMEKGHTVLALDDLSRGLNDIRNVATSSITFVRHDCRGGIFEARRVWSGAADSVDAVVHLAAGTGSLDRPLEELRGLNVEMTKRVYEDAVALGAKVFAFPTTSLALGVPDSPYVISKEEAFQWVKAQTRVPVLPLRFFNVAGAYKRFSEFRKHEVHIIPRLVDCYRSGGDFVINGDDYDTVDGTPSRDFVNVLDVVETILHGLGLVASGIEPPKQVDGAVWIGTGRTMTALQTMRVFEQYVGNVGWKIGPRRAFDVGELRCPPAAVDFVRTARHGDLVPAWVSVRDEALTLRRQT
jgi:UDP-glucose 4-epimerase